MKYNNEYGGICHETIKKGDKILIRCVVKSCQFCKHFSFNPEANAWMSTRSQTNSHSVYYHKQGETRQITNKQNLEKTFGIVENSEGLSVAETPVQVIENAEPFQQSEPNSPIQKEATLKPDNLLIVATKH